MIHSRCYFFGCVASQVFAERIAVQLASGFLRGARKLLGLLEDIVGNGYRRFHTLFTFAPSGLSRSLYPGLRFASPGATIQRRFGGSTALGRLSQ